MNCLKVLIVKFQKTNIIVSNPVYEWCFADMKMKKTPKFKQKVLSEVEEVEWKGVGQGGGKPQPLGRAPASGGIPKGRDRVPTSSKPMGVPGRHSSDWKHNPFSALATAARQSAKAAKRKSTSLRWSWLWWWGWMEEGQERSRFSWEGPS